MSLVAWTDKYNVNVREIDAQHAQMAILVNQFHDAVVSDKSIEMLDDILVDLLAYIKEHFSTEERFMVEHRYPEYSIHKEEHDRLLKQLVGFRHIALGRPRSALRFNFDASRDWFIQHIEAYDKKLGWFLNENNIF